MYVFLEIEYYLILSIYIPLGKVYHWITNTKERKKYLLSFIKWNFQIY